MKRTKWRGVITDAERGRIEYRKSAVFLQRNFLFDHRLKLPAGKLSVLDDILKVGKKQTRLDLEILIANLWNARRKSLAVPLNRKHWTKSKSRRASVNIIELIHTLHKQDFIKMEPGFHYTPHEARNTRIWATDKLLQYCRELPRQVISEPTTLVELRDERGKFIEYQDTAKTLRITAKLERINNVNSRADILYGNHKITAYLIAIYKNSFDLYGRLHTSGYNHMQGFSENERSEFTINSEPVVELDFSAIHPNLLYATEGIQFKGDPYTIIDDRPEARPFLKRILLAMLNAKNELQALRAANYIFFQDREEKKRLNAIGITTAKPFIKLFKEAHKPISHYFCTGKETGMRIMNKDARIALDICTHFAKQNTPILAVHDSFIIQRKHRDELEEIMQKTYKKHSGGFSCIIK